MKLKLNDIFILSNPNYNNKISQANNHLHHLNCDDGVTLPKLPKLLSWILRYCYLGCRYFWSLSAKYFYTCFGI